MTNQNPWSEDPHQLSGGQGNPSPETSSFPPVAPPQQSTPPFGEPQHPQHPPQYQQFPPQNPPKLKNRWLLAVTMVIAVLLLTGLCLAVASVAGWVNFGNQNEAVEAGEPGDTVIVTEVVVVPGEDGQEAPAGAEVVRPAPVPQGDDRAVNQSRPSRVSLPNNAYAANASARTGEPDGDFNNVYTGSSVTSVEFARYVRSAFADFYYNTGQTSGTITAYSPVTGLNYTMNCTDNGSYVTCTGGNNAVVYIS